MRAQLSKIKNAPGIYRVGDSQDRFEIRYSQGTDPLTKRSKIVSERFRGSLKEAKLRQAELKLNSRNPLTGQITGWSMDQLMKEYFEYAKEHLEPLTLQSDLGRWVIMQPFVGHLRARAVNPLIIDRLFRELMSKRSMKPQTINRYRSLLSAAFRKGGDWGVTSINPVEGTRAKTPQSVHRSELSLTLVQRIFDLLAEHHPDYNDFLRLTFLLGCRRGETCALKVTDYDPESKTLTVWQAVKELKGGKIEVGDAKAHNKRAVKLHPAAIQVVERRFSETSRFIFSDDGGVTPWRPGRITGFITEFRKRICPECMTLSPLHATWCAKCESKLGVQFVVKDLRRLNATSQLRGGVNPAHVARSGGWKDKNVMFNHYSDAVDGDAAVSHAALDAALNFGT